jgi:hypothetical protein
MTGRAHFVSDGSEHAPRDPPISLALDLGGCARRNKALVCERAHAAPHVQGTQFGPEGVVVGFVELDETIEGACLAKLLVLEAELVKVAELLEHHSVRPNAQHQLRREAPSAACSC